MAQQLFREGLAAQITQHIRDQIAAGELIHGQSLAPTRKLADEWGVSAKTINDALAPLVAEGLVVSRDRSGRVINAPNQQPNLAKRVSQLESQVAALQARLDRLESVPPAESAQE